ncbi:hypothetical protein AAMO2058_000900800, partial [Amorphochlora amoebiformis]
NSIIHIQTSSTITTNPRINIRATRRNLTPQQNPTPNPSRNPTPPPHQNRPFQIPADIRGAGNARAGQAGLDLSQIMQQMVRKLNPSPKDFSVLNLFHSGSPHQLGSLQYVSTPTPTTPTTAKPQPNPPTPPAQRTEQPRSEPCSQSSIYKGDNRASPKGL